MNALQMFLVVRNTLVPYIGLCVIFWIATSVNPSDGYTPTEEEQKVRKLVRIRWIVAITVFYIALIALAYFVPDFASWIANWQFPGFAN
ncbi:MAG: hypothetical protein NTW50_04590 [Candidatus Berkelbacteria bacterium]|nr:hypothetical protein [Candidatus Berkelbacteria bacterium]